MGVMGGMVQQRRGLWGIGRTKMCCGRGESALYLAVVFGGLPGYTRGFFAAEHARRSARGHARARRGGGNGEFPE